MNKRLADGVDTRANLKPLSMPKNNKNVAVSLIEGEDPLLYQSREEELLNHFRPTEKAEIEVIKEIAWHRWLVQRAIRWQEEYLARTKWTLSRDFVVLLRYQSLNDSRSQRLLKMLLALRKQAALDSGLLPNSPPTPITFSRISPDVADKWAHNTCVFDKKSGTFMLLKVLRDREEEQDENRLF